MSRREFSQRRRSCAHFARAAAVFLVMIAPALGAAAAYLPSDDATVLERVPAQAAVARLAPLRKAVAADRRDLASALDLARGYIDIGRTNGDPRFVAYAEATLAPWMAQPQPPEPVLVLQATALQYLHQFSAALQLLDRAIAKSPGDPQAWLTRAALLELRGDYAEARRACGRLVQSADQLVALTCLASINSRSGRLAASYRALRAPPLDDSRLPAALRSWTLAELGDMAERLGDDLAAERCYRATLAIAPQDGFVKTAYADLLLRQQRNREAIGLLHDGEPQDNLLLRLAIAGQRTTSADGARWAALYEARLQAAERARDRTHLREQALFALDVRHDPARAVNLAAANWAVQREPADVRVYARAARAAGSRADLDVIARWANDVHYEDRVLGDLASRGSEPDR